MFRVVAAAILPSECRAASMACPDTTDHIAHTPLVSAANTLLEAGSTLTAQMRELCWKPKELAQLSICRKEHRETRPEAFTSANATGVSAMGLISRIELRPTCLQALPGVKAVADQMAPA